MIEAWREVQGEVSTERRYYLSSRLADAATLGPAVRDHWGIENQLYWSLDVTFGEDQARLRTGNAAENFSILRRLALNLFRQDKSVKAGVKARRLLASTDDTYRQKLLGLQVGSCLMRLPWLHHPPVGHTAVLHHTPIAVFFAVFLTGFGAQEQAGSCRQNRRPAQGPRSARQTVAHDPRANDPRLTAPSGAKIAPK
jgi:predicted transposase YbfD/YdcC